MGGVDGAMLKVLEAQIQRGRGDVWGFGIFSKSYFIEIPLSESTPEQEYTYYY